MNIGDIAKLISDYGLAIIISALFIYAAVRAINLGFTYVQERLGHKRHDDMLELRNEIDEEVDTELNNFFVEHNGNRLQLIEFTNSVMSVAYLPFKYMQCTHEVFQYGDRSEAKNVDKLSTSLFSPFLSELGKNPYVILDHENEHQYGAVHELFDSMSMDKVICVMLKTSKDKAIGFVAFEPLDGDVNPEVVEDIESLSEKLSALLGVMDK